MTDLRLVTRVPWFWNVLGRLMNYSQCARCRRGWNFRDFHTVWWMPDVGQSALCEKCWGETTPRQRVNWYRRFMADGETRGNEWPEKERILAAVAAEPE